MNNRLATAAYLIIICIQCIIIMWFVLQSGHQRTQIATLQEEVTDWEQIAASYRSAAARYALSSEKCLQTMRVYQSSMFQPAEIGK